MPRVFARSFSCLLLIAVSLLAGACTHSSSEHDGGSSSSDPAQERPKLAFSGKTMGVTWNATIAVVSNANGTDAAETLAAIQDALDRVDQRMSTYKPESEISRFALATAGTAFKVSAETAMVVREAQRIAALSHGAFDATVMPLVDLWGFGPATPSGTAPTEDELQATLEICGWKKLTVGDRHTLRKTVDGLKIDLSAIAKGYGVDAVCEALKEQGWTDYMVEVGGELRTAGKSPSGGAWRIGIDAPRDMSNAGQDLQAVLQLGTVAVATSGDYRNFRYVDGERISHTIDPRYGVPVKHDLASVTVLAPNCMLADALATTCMVLGPEEGMKLIRGINHVECYMIIRDGDTLMTDRSPGFPELQD
ncbi:MAG: FAD:protein FMN transferase [Planctomycetes bacterium]|nr:FAD:protein FMN transferase [Planctomycetota bacterium]MCP4770494.1 FAD:protein FMN transferase [Planctomycetota bacterium]MCP4859934.1 FAD:protein FMN transferase [Planctomycetota bacterium]